MELRFHPRLERVTPMQTSLWQVAAEVLRLLLVCLLLLLGIELLSTARLNGQQCVVENGYMSPCWVYPHRWGTFIWYREMKQAQRIAAGGQ